MRVAITHNHGRLVLDNVRVEEFAWGDGTTYDRVEKRIVPVRDRIGKRLVGTVVSGHSTSRLFHASHTTHDTPGVEMSYDIYGRQIRQEADGTFSVDCTFCG